MNDINNKETICYQKTFKLVFGERMMNIVLDMGRNIRRANRAADPQQHYHYIEEVLMLVEDLEALVDASFEHKAISAKQFSKSVKFIGASLSVA